MIVDGTYYGVTYSATNDGGATCGNTSASPDVWFLYTPPNTGSITINTSGSNFDTVLSVHNPSVNGCPGDPSDEIACDDDSGYGWTSSLTLSVTAGETLLIRLGGYYDATGIYNLNVSPAASLSGRVTDEVTVLPIADAWVVLSQVDGHGEYDAARTGAGGYYSFPNITNGNYIVSAGSSGYRAEYYANGTPVPVSGNVTGIDIALSPLGSISGRVTDSSGAGLRHPQVHVYDAAGQHLDSVWGDAGGNYHIQNLDAGIYFVMTGNNQGYVDEIYDNILCSAECPVWNGTPVTVSLASTTSGIDFVLAHGGSISGTITNERTGAPVKGMGVEIRDSKGFVVSNSYSDPSGNYEAGGLQSGSYYVLTSDDHDEFDFLEELYPGVPWGNCCALSSGTPVSVTQGADTSGINFGLRKGGKISGSITEANTGNPIADSYVSIYDIGGNGRVGVAYPDAMGNYTSPGLNDGVYFLKVSTGVWDDYVDQVYDNIACSRCNPATGNPVVIANRSHVTGIDFQIERGGSISGTIIDQLTGGPIAGVATAFDACGEFEDKGYAGDSGNYSIRGLSEGNHFVVGDDFRHIPELFDGLPCPYSRCDVTSGNPVNVSYGSTTSPVDFILGPYGAITGSLTDGQTGLPAQYVWINAHDSAGQSVNGSLTHADGTYEISVTAGDYYIRTVSNSEYVDQLYPNIPCEPSCDFTPGALVHVNDGQTVTGIDMTLQRGGGISGKVVDASSGFPLQSVYISIYNASGDWIAGGFGSSYQARGLPAGTYYVKAWSRAYIGELYDNIPCPYETCPLASGTPVTVTDGNTTQNIDFHLDRGGKIRAGVFNANHQTVPFDGRLEIYDQTGLLLKTSYYFVEADGIPAGNYFIRSQGNRFLQDELYNNIPCDSYCNPLSGTPVSVTAGETTYVELILDPNGTISGSVTDIGSSPLRNVPIQVYDTSGNLVGSGTSSCNGRYTLAEGLKEGIYFSRTANTSGYVDELYDNIPCVAECNPVTGTPIVVTRAGAAENIDFSLSQTAWLFYDDFEDGILAQDWTYSQGTWDENTGSLTGTSPGKAPAVAAPVFSGCDSCTAHSLMTYGGAVDPRKTSVVSLLGWYQDEDNLVELQMKAQTGKWVLEQRINGKVVAKKKARMVIAQNTSYDVRLVYDGVEFRLYVDQQLAIRMQSVGTPQGTVGFQTRNASARFDLIQVY